MICGHGDEHLPDLGLGCCWGASMYGPERCTCWETVHDREQAEPRPAPVTVRPGMCGDCAYRPGSHERSGDVEYAGDPDALEDLAATGRRFWCHDGMRRVALQRHPSGAEVPGHPGAYDPPIVAGVPYRADGSPALLCAGWHARHRALTAPAARTRR